jgi:CspA family cold shock protein
VFVHITAVQRAGLDGLNDNQKISFEVETGRNGREAATDLQAQ